jgi:hypothetical protein
MCYTLGSRLYATLQFPCHKGMLETPTWSERCSSSPACIGSARKQGPGATQYVPSRIPSGKGRANPQIRGPPEQCTAVLAELHQSSSSQRWWCQDHRRNPKKRCNPPALVILRCIISASLTGMHSKQEVSLYEVLS